METRRQDRDILSHQFRGKRERRERERQKQREKERERERHREIERERKYTRKWLVGGHHVHWHHGMIRNNRHDIESGHY